MATKPPSRKCTRAPGYMVFFPTNLSYWFSFALAFFFLFYGLRVSIPLHLFFFCCFFVTCTVMCKSPSRLVFLLPFAQILCIRIKIELNLRFLDTLNRLRIVNKFRAKLPKVSMLKHWPC